MQKLLGIFPVEVVVLCIIATISRPLIRNIAIARFQNEILRIHQRGPKTIYVENIVGPISTPVDLHKCMKKWSSTKSIFGLYQTCFLLPV